MNIKVFLLSLCFLSSSVGYVYADDIATFNFQENEARQRFTVRPVAPVDLQHGGRINAKQHALRAATFLNYDVSAFRNSCFFFALQVPRQKLIHQLVAATQEDSPRAEAIRTALQYPILENMGLAHELVTNPGRKITKAEARAFLITFALDGMYTPFEVAVAYGIFAQKNVYVWQHQPGKRLGLLDFHDGGHPETIHMAYYPHHYQRLELDQDSDARFKRAKSLLIERRGNTFLTPAEETRLRERVMRLLSPLPSIQMPRLALPLRQRSLSRQETPLRRVVSLPVRTSPQVLPQRGLLANSPPLSLRTLDAPAPSRVPQVSHTKPVAPLPPSKINQMARAPQKPLLLKLSLSRSLRTSTIGKTAQAQPALVNPILKRTVLRQQKLSSVTRSRSMTIGNLRKVSQPIQRPPLKSLRSFSSLKLIPRSLRRVK